MLVGKRSILYFKAPMKVYLYNKENILLKDLGILHGEEELCNKIKNVKITKIKDPKKKEQLTVSMMDIIVIVHREYPDIEISNLGEKDVVIFYEPVKKKENKLWTFAKVATVCMTLLCGSAFAIMTFHTDASVPNVFATINEVFVGEYIEKPLWVIIPYSVGLVVGVTVFFNHMGTKKLTEDPTPIQVELEKYDTEVNTCLVDLLTNENDKERKKV